VRESEVAAESLGLSPYWVRTVAFTVGAAFAGVGGALYAFLAGFVSPDSFTAQASILFLLVILFGGLGRVLGPVVGAAPAVWCGRHRCRAERPRSPGSSPRSSATASTLRLPDPRGVCGD
jgi:ABC-type branched-subunit amino acid transport system permease subunit